MSTAPYLTEHESLILDAARSILTTIAERCNAAEFHAPEGYVPGVSKRDLIVAGTIASRAEMNLGTSLIGLRVYLDAGTTEQDAPAEPQSLTVPS